MKKSYSFLIPFLALGAISLGACKKKDKNVVFDRTLLSYGDVNATESREISLNQLDDLIDNKDNFLLVITSSGCSCWMTFERNLNAYISEYNILCYRVSYNQIKDVASAYGLTKLKDSNTTFTIFKDGALKVSINSDNDSDYMYDKKTFYSWMDEKVIRPTCYYISVIDYDRIKASNKSAVVYFARSGCGDCSSINKGIFQSYVKSHTDSGKIYILDCQDYYRRPTDPDYADYLDFKNEMGMSNVNNPVYGYDSGVFPFFSFIQNGEYKSGAVVYNDNVEKIDNKFYVTHSYYSEDRVSSLDYTSTVLVGTELSQSDVYEGEGYVIWKQSAADRLYEPILKSFLDYALPKVTFEF